MPNPFAKLRGIELSGPNTQPSELEKPSKKPLDVVVRRILESNPELKERIVDVMRAMSSSSEMLPLTHITTDQIVLPDGSSRDSEMVRQIENQGFRGRHTNIGAFVVRKGQARLAQPEDYKKAPEDFLKSLIILLRRYWHHGSRTNKDIYAEQRDQGRGSPIMILLQGNLPLERGTDHDDHYILKENAPPNTILGKIRLRTETGIDDKMISRVAHDLLEIMNSYTTKDSSRN